MADVKLGTWSTILLLGSLHGLAMASLLAFSKRNRLANRCLATLLLAVVLLITPFTIGYAGFYDAWPWLTYAPFFWQLAFGPLVWLYVRQLGQAALPPKWRWHFLPAALQGLYFFCLFLQPLPVKWRWDEKVHLPFVAPVLEALIFASMAAYWLMAWRAYGVYQRWLEQHSGAREEYRLHWLRRFLWAMALVIAINLGFTLIDRFVARLDYFDQFPLYLAFVALVYYLGLEGWRHADDPYPQPSPAVEAAAVASQPIAERDWRALGEQYRAQVQAQGWWRESDLDLSGLARRLGTNTLYLSRALNEGLEQNFSEFINRQRTEAARGLLSGASSVLEIALAVGFGSKASFNRAFRAYVGCTPSEYRLRGQDPP
ncbi:helix-turn-helix transcriptional regulator [Lysobacter sp. Root604]|uniref:helix-turn-helix domain-containing protein n=1 Tax=Lysobacter sp. Root604 TaxID=1736568 RepID=UPI0006F457B1|nr:helix-turn-helix transcriptional regulator [Lysobacter sp. Root604]KRA14996.1 AraC family transcriptional regulator [Lysobacter sp. Root604]